MYLTHGSKKVQGVLFVSKTNIPFKKLNKEKGLKF